MLLALFKKLLNLVKHKPIATKQRVDLDLKQAQARLRLLEIRARIHARDSK